MLPNLTRILCVVCMLVSFGLAPAARAHQEPSGEFGAGKSLEFIENRNQWPAAVRYSAMLPGGQLFLKDNQWVFSFVDESRFANHGRPETAPANKAGAPAPEEKIAAHAYTVTFLNANPKPAFKTEKPTPGFRNYFIGNDQAKWASNVKAFEVLEYQEMYPGIATRLYETGQKLKYDFILQPGADPARIRMQYAGAEKLALQEGSLVIKTSVNTVTEQKPIAYQLINGKRKEVPCKFVLKDNVLSFEFPKGYRKKSELIIDPTLIFSSYSGATADNWGFTATYDNQGNMYSGGVVFFHSGGLYPATPGAFQVFGSGAADIGIMKYNPNVSGAASRVWATYLGGIGVEAPHSLVVNSQNELLVLGTTSSSNFPVTNSAFDRFFNGGPFIDPLNFGSNDFLAYNGGSDIFITKFSASGNNLAASTYVGGTNNDGLLRIFSPLVRNYGDQFRGDIFTDAADNVYIASSTASLDFPVVNGFQPVYGGGQNDAVICRFSPNLNSLTWSSYLGGTGADAVYSVQVDLQQNIYVCGGTTSTNLSQTSGAFKPAFTTGTDAVEGFVSKIINNGSLFRTTYIGASPGYDQTYFIQLDASNNVYVLGQSLAYYPATSGVYTAKPGRQFIQKLNNTLSAGIFSLNFGSGTFIPKYDISPTAFLVDNCERLFVCGWGGIDNQIDPKYVGGTTHGLPVTGNAQQGTTDGSDFYLMQLSQNGTNLDYGTFLGGSSSASPEHVDGGTSRFDKRGFIYQAVCAGCGGTNAFPTTPNAWATTNGNAPAGNADNCNAAAFKFDFAVSSAIVGGRQVACLNGGTVAVTGASPAGGIWTGPGVINSSMFDPQVAGVGTHVLTYTVRVGNCISQATKQMVVPPPVTVSFTIPDSVFCVYSTPVTLTPSRPGGVFSGPGVVNQNKFSAVAAGPGMHQLRYTFTDSVGCISFATETVIVDTPPIVTAGPPEGVCAKADPIQLTGASPAGGTWTGPGVTSSGLFTPSESLIGTQTLAYSVTIGKCTYSATRQVLVDPVPDVFADLQYGNCGVLKKAAGYAPLKVTFRNNTPVGQRFWWDFGDGNTSTEFSPEHTYTKAGTYTVTLAIDFGRNCIRMATVNTITVIDPILPNVITPNGDFLNDTFMPRVSCLPVTVKIYNRWGQLVYQRENYNETFDGGNLSGGTYYYHIQDSDKRSWKGWLEIIK